MNDTLVSRMIGAAKLDAATYERVEADPGALGQAMTVVLLSAVAAGIGALGHGGIGVVLLTILGAVVGWFVWAALTWLIGTRLLPEPQTQADFGQLLRTIGFSASPGVLRVLGFLPLLGWLINLVAMIWMLVAMVVAVRQALDYRGTGRAVAVCAIGFVIYLVASVAVGMVFGGATAMMGGTGGG